MPKEGESGRERGEGGETERMEIEKAVWAKEGQSEEDQLS